MPIITRGHDVVKLSSERFRKNDPLIFEGDTNSLMANEWIKNIEEIFEYTNIPDEDKVICATYILQKDAHH